MTLPNVMITIGTLFIAIGGFLATHGWSARTEAVQKDGLIRAVAAELMLNIQIVSDQKFIEDNKLKLEEFVIFLRAQTVALEGAIASGIFLSEVDRELLTRFTNLRELLSEFNQRLTFTESQILQQTPKTRATTRASVGDSPLRSGIDSKLRVLGQLLVASYGISTNDRFFVELEEDAI